MNHPLDQRSVIRFYALLLLVAVAGIAAQQSWYWFYIDVTVVQHILLGIGIGALLAFLSRGFRFFTWGLRLQEEFSAMFAGATHRQIIIAALCSGIAEEVFFRAMLQPVLGVWLTALLFALLHTGPNKRYIAWTVMAFLMGIGLGFGVLYCGHIWAAIAVHISVNYLNLRYLTSTPQLQQIVLGPPAL